MDVSLGKPRVLVFEWLVGGGLLVDQQSPSECSSMFRQGASMRRAIAEDFAAAGCKVVTTTDSRWNDSFESGESIAVHAGEDLPGQLRRLASGSDYLFVIAPESGGRLVQVLDWLEPFAERLLSPGRKWSELFSDKQATCEWLSRVGVRVPFGLSWTSGLDVWPPGVALPVVCKPVDGCGGEGLRIVQGGWGAASDLGSGKWRVEKLTDGEAVSVLALLGPKEQLLLQPTRQRFSQEAFGVYVGGEMVEDEQVKAAVWRAVEPALRAMEGVRGVVGFDLVLGRETNADRFGAGDTCAERLGGEGTCAAYSCEAGDWVVTVIEINPRLTSSYLGLRQSYACNLADCLLRLVRGEPARDLLLRRSQPGLSWGVE